MASAEVEVITKEDQKKALVDFTRAWKKSEGASVDLWNAARHLQETQGWEADDAFMNDLASGRVVVGKDQSIFAVYMEHRFDVGRPRAYQLANAGRVVAALSTTVESLPQNERTIRELMPVLDRPQGDGVERVNQIWEKAQELAAEQKKSANSRHVRDAIKATGIKVRGKRIVIIEEETSKHVRQARQAIKWLIDNEREQAIKDLFDWIDHAVTEANRRR